MSHCHDEHSGHGHDHHHGGDGHDHSNDITPADQTRLYEQVDFDKIITLNEEEPQSGKAITKKTWAERLDSEPELASDADEQLLMHIPFTGQVQLHSISIRTSPSSSAPRTLHVYVNPKETFSWDDVSDSTPTQRFDLSQTSEVQELLVNRPKYSTTRNLALFYKDNFGDDVTRLSYVGFKGKHMSLNREAISFLYEAAANPADHKVGVGSQRIVERGV
ncbi:PITH domain-containing protein [Cryomyces antarcticus]|nr:hypothetical protein LTR60_005180 [Cryomyces antarcticus]